MRTSQYDAETRKEWKRVQRSPAYQALRNRFVQLETKLRDRDAVILQLETKLRDRDAVISRLKERLRLSGLAFEEVERLAA